MATKRDLLKEAIADAKAVKETAIANAKAALEEAFTPQLKSILSAKLQEMEMEEEEELDEAGFGKGRAEGDVGFSSMGEKALDEEDKDMIEVDLEELLAELNEEEDEMEEGLYEAEEGEETEEEAEDEEGEALDLEDMTDEDLKKMIEDVIADMVESGELEAGHGGEGEEEEEGEEMEMSDEEEVDLAELLREIEEMEKDEMYEEEEMDEGILSKIGNVATRVLGGGDAAKAREVFKQVLDDNKDLVDQYAATKDPQALRSLKFEAYNALVKAKLSGGGELDYLNDFIGKVKGDPRGIMQKFAAGSGGSVSIAREGMEEELEEAYNTIKALKNELNEINLLNAKLLYSNKIFKSKNLNENQKVKVLSSFDRATTVGEVKMVFETLSEGIKVPKSTIKENLGRASKATVTPTVKKPIVESNDAFLRMQKLAGLI